MAAASAVQYEVESIVDSMVDKGPDGKYIAKFEVKWVGYTETSWEPFSCVRELPLLLTDFRDASEKKMLDSIASSTKVTETTKKSLPRFPLVNSGILSTFRHPEEYIPKGCESVGQVIEIVTRNGVDLYWIQFKGSHTYHFVRDCLFEYYFPVSASWHFLRQQRKEQKLKSFVAGAKKK